MKKIMVRAVLIFACVWCTVSLLYLFAGLLIVLHSEEGVASLIQAAGKAEAISAIAGVFSAIAAFMSYCSANRSAIAAENANVIARLPDRLKARDALSMMWGFLNLKSCALSFDESDPGKFLITKDDIEFLEGLREALYCCSFAYGKEFSDKLIDFYTRLKSELKGQMACTESNCGLNGMTLDSESQKRYLLLRKEMREEVFCLLQDASRRLFFVLI